MKKREPVKKKDNIIFFPGLEKRLLEKGLESLQAKRYIEAISLLEEFKKLDPANEDALIGLVLAYYESSQFQNAKILAKDMLLRGIGDYAQMVELYLTILIQLREYQEIVSTIEALIDENEVPPDKYEHFLTILQFSRRMAAKNQSPKEELAGQDLEGPADGEFNLFALKDPKEQLRLISELADRNIRPYIQTIKAYLRSDEGHPLLKTMLLDLLRDQEYDKEVVVRKFNLESELIPSDLPEVRSQARMGAIIGNLKTNLENNDPILFENIKSLVERHFLIVYPFSLEPLNANAWAAAFHYIGLEYYGMGPEFSDVSDKYNSSVKDIEAAVGLIKEFEEISYPII